MTTIWDEVLDGNAAGVRGLLENVNVRNGLGETPLHLAARHGLEEIAEVLLDAGADLHAKDWESGWTPLHRSLYFGHIRLSLLLLKEGALMDAGRDYKGNRQKYRPRSRSESRAPHSEGKVRGILNARQRSESLGDDEGNSPLDVLSLELRPQLKAARESGLGGDVYSFGKADFTLGYDSFGRADVVRPRRVEALANLHVTRVAASRHHSAALTECGRLYTWGHGKCGRLGHGNEQVCMLPAQVKGLAHQRVTDVATAESHTAAVTSNGELYTWGRDRFGQLGHGSGSGGRLAPKRVESLRKVEVVGVAAGSEHTAVVTLSGNCYTFGRNNHGQLGLEGVKEARSPRVVSGLSSGLSRGAGGVARHVIKVSASERSTVVVTRGKDRGSGLQPVNEVFCWGLGSHVPTRINFNNAKEAASSTRWQTHDARIDIVDVAAARCHNIALDRIGRVFSWGFGADNLGLDPRETRTERGPRLVAAMLPENCGGNPVHISASDQHSCVVTDTGDLFTWGTSGEGGALGHGDERWQPLAKRVPSLKKVVSVAAAHDHTIVMCAASCPSLPHGASFTPVNVVRGKGENITHPSPEEGDEDEDGDVDSEVDDEESNEEIPAAQGGLFTTNSCGRFEPLSLKQICETKLAKEVDLHNAGAMLAYADALDASALVQFCAEFVVSNLDGILVMGRESDRDCLLEASVSRALGSEAFSVLRGARARVPRIRASMNGPAAARAQEEEEGLDLQREATALARAEMRSHIPSAKAAARAVRSLKKKLTRIREWELARERGEHLSSEQMSKVNQKASMEAELTSLDSQLERAKMAQAARCRRLEAGKTEKTEVSSGGKPSEAKRVLPSNVSDVDCRGHPTLDPDLQSGADQWTLQLDLSNEEMKENARQPITCEACSVKCNDAAMYADHLSGKRHRATTLRLEQELQRAANESNVSRSRANVSVVQDRSSAAVASTAETSSSAFAVGPNLRERSRGRRASCPEPSVPSHSSRTGSGSSQMFHGNGGTMREALEHQQRAATVFMADTSKDETAIAAHTLTVLNSCANPTPRGSSHHPTSQQSLSQQDARTPSVYSLVDFIAAPGGKKSSRRIGASDRNNQKVGKVWGEEVIATENPVCSGEARENGVPLKSGKSFHEILEEEEREKQRREEYGDSVWFVPGKPRSTSFESIVQQQRREERVAEEERLRQLDEDMLELALEMSKQEAQSKSASSTIQAKRNREGRRTRHKKGAGDAGGRRQESKTQRHHPTTRAESSSQPVGCRETLHVQNRNGRSRRTKRSVAGVNKTTEPKFGTSGTSAP